MINLTLYTTFTLLPFSPTQALVESTLFSTKVLEEEFYIDSINQYLSSHYGATVKKIAHQEKGVIPMGKLSQHDPKIPGLGANAGAIRPAEWICVCVHASANSQSDQEDKER